MLAWGKEAGLRPNKFLQVTLVGGLIKPLMNAIMQRHITKIKTKYMLKPGITKVKSSKLIQATVFVAIAAIFAGSQIMPVLVSADRFDEQIQKLESQNDKKEASQDILSQEASSLADAINRLQSQINASQKRIDQLNGEITQLKKEIKAAEIELEKQKDLLGQSIKAMYVSGEISTVEMLASSKDLSDFFDKQQYQESVRSKIKNTLDKVTQLKLELNTKKERVEKSLAEQENLRAQLAAQQAEKNRVLSLNQAEQNKLEQQIENNSDKIAELRRQQAIENARLFASSGGIASIPDTTGYPWASFMGSAWTHAGSCGYAGDPDPFGACKRQCVSYAAWKVWKRTGISPYGYGNANNWDEAAAANGYTVDGNPGKGNDGTIAVSNYGTWGHVMYVESVNGNGTINVSQYNVQLTGTYSEAYNMSTNGLVFIHFR